MLLLHGTSNRYTTCIDLDDKRLWKIRQLKYAGICESAFLNSLKQRFSASHQINSLGRPLHVISDKGTDSSENCGMNELKPTCHSQKWLQLSLKAAGKDTVITHSRREFTLFHCDFTVTNHVFNVGGRIVTLVKNELSMTRCSSQGMVCQLRHRRNCQHHWRLQVTCALSVAPLFLSPNSVRQKRKQPWSGVENL
jgi:hypothetical protein